MYKMSSFKEKAEKAINKEAAIGLDVDLEEYDQDSVDQHEKIDSLSELNKKDQEILESVGVEPDEKTDQHHFYKEIKHLYLKIICTMVLK